MSDMESTNSPNDLKTREFLRLLGEHDPGLRRFVFALVPHWADSQDIVQELHLRLWDQFDQYDRTKNFGAWARTIAYYLVLAHREERSRRNDTTLLSETFMKAAAREAVNQAEMLEERKHVLRQCLRKMAAGTRDLLMRCYEGKETLHQIAERLGRTYDATRKAVLRTRQSLAKCIEETLEERAG